MTLVKIFSHENQKQLQDIVNRWVLKNPEIQVVSMGFTYDHNGTYSIAVFYKPAAALTALEGSDAPIISQDEPGKQPI